MGIIKTAFTLLFLYFAYKAVLFVTRVKQRANIASAKTASVEDLLRDPVCGRYFSAQTGVKLKKNGKTYYFCSKECMEKFRDRRI